MRSSGTSPGSSPSSSSRCSRRSSYRSCVGSSLSMQKFGICFIWTENWDPVKEEFGALVPIYGTLVTSAIALAIASPGELRHRDLPHRAVAPCGCAARSAPPSRCWPPSPASSTACGASSSSCRSSSARAAPAGQDPRRVPAPRACSSPGPPLGIGMLTAGIILAVMVIPFIAAVMRDVFELVPPDAQGVAPTGWAATTWEVVWRVVLPYTQGRRDRRHHARPRARARRDHGGHLRDRQRAPVQRLALRARATRSPRRSPTSSPRRWATSTPRALIELGLLLFLITTIVLALAKLLLLQLAKREGRA